MFLLPSFAQSRIFSFSATLLICVCLSQPPTQNRTKAHLLWLLGVIILFLGMFPALMVSKFFLLFQLNPGSPSCPYGSYVPKDLEPGILRACFSLSPASSFLYGLLSEETHVWYLQSWANDSECTGGAQRHDRNPFVTSPHS